VVKNYVSILSHVIQSKQYLPFLLLSFCQNYKCEYRKRKQGKLTPRGENRKIDPVGKAERQTDPLKQADRQIQWDKQADRQIL
jgi:hypothetical protein